MNSFITWKGGKKLLRKRIIAEFPPSETFDRYIEVFGGAGWVLFGSEKHAKIEIYNDINGNLVNLFRCVKYHPEALQKELEWILMSREQFFNAKDQIQNRGLTDIQRAARFWILIKESFGADCSSFGVKQSDIQGELKVLFHAVQRLKRVIIENIDFEHLIQTYDREAAPFYLEPPYYRAEKYYSDKFEPEDHKRLRNALGGIKGKFVLSYNDCQEIRQLYKGYNIIEADRTDNLLTKSGSRRYKELIIKNF